MTLLEKLDSMDRNRIVYIGAKHGSGWIFMDTVDEVLKNLDSMDRKLYKKKRLGLSKTLTQNWKSIP